MNPIKSLTESERETLETYIRSRLDSDLRNCLIILVALHSGARATELLNILWSDISLETGAVWLRTLKHGKNRAIVLPKFLLEPLARLKATSANKPFDLSYNRLGEIWRQYRTVDKPFHSLRHSFAMRAYSRTKDIRFVQKALGHSSLRNTMVYADHEYSAQEFKKMMGVR